MVINRDLPLGLLANTAAVLAASIGDKIKGLIGEDVFDADGSLHPGITGTPIAILSGDDELIRAIRQKLLEAPKENLYFVDFCNVAQRSKVYDEYKANLITTPADQLSYLGIAMVGPNKQIERLTGNVALLR
jgi:hypothetical protein